MTETCGCDAVQDKASWHEYRHLPLCDEAREYRSVKSRRRYARKRARAGKTVVPGPARQGWIPGTEVIIPEEDPL